MKTVTPSQRETLMLDKETHEKLISQQEFLGMNLELHWLNLMTEREFHFFIANTTQKTIVRLLIVTVKLLQADDDVKLNPENYREFLDKMFSEQYRLQIRNIKTMHFQYSATRTIAKMAAST